MPQADSDYDIYVVIPDDGLQPITAMGNIRKALLSIQARPLDVLVGYSSVFEKRTHWPASLEGEIARKVGCSMEEAIQSSREWLEYARWD